MKIGRHDLNEAVFIIAEIGNNHEGNFALAQEMIELAAKAGVDAVKFQTFIPEFYISNSDRDRLERLRKYQFSIDQFKKLSQQAAKNGLVFLSTPFDLKSAQALNDIQEVFKISSGDNSFYPLLDTVASFNKPLIVSTGLTNIDEVKAIYDFICQAWSQIKINPGLAFLHCVSSYPVPKEQANLRAIKTLREHLPDAIIGYSDHTLGIETAIYAVAVGAQIIEKHFTIDKNYSAFRDHQLSADPDDMHRLVKRIRDLTERMGTGEKVPQPSELEMIKAVRRSIALSQDLPSGTILKLEHLTWVRPAIGLACGQEDQVIGRQTTKSLMQGHILTLDDLA